MHQQYMLLKLRKPNLKYTLKSIMSIGFPLLNISNCQSVLKYLSLIWQIVYNLHDSYVTRFDFLNYAFANLEVAWL